MYSLATVVSAVSGGSIVSTHAGPQSSESKALRITHWMTFDPNSRRPISCKNSLLYLLQSRCIQYSTTASPVSPHLWTSSHTAVMEMELKFFRRNSTEQNPRSLVDHIQKMKSGEAPFFPATLGLVYDTLFSKVFPQPVASGSGLGGPSKIGKSATKRTFAVQKSGHVPCFGLTPTLSSRPQQGLYNRYSDSDSDSDSDYL